MRKLAILVLALAACDPTPPDYELRFGLTKEEIEAAPSYHQMKGALLNDVRIWRELEKKLDEGKPSCAGILYENDLTLCANDRTELEFYILSPDLPDRLYRVEETAYYCRKEGIYYYHYVGGPRRLNVWLGPYSLKRERPKVEE